MTQTNNEREALKKALLELECYKGEILLDGNRPNDLRDLNETILIVKSAIAQSEQQEAVAEVRLDENNMKYIHWYKPWVHVLSSNSKLYLSPPKQAIPDITVETKLPFDVYFGKGKVGKGCTFGTLIQRISAQSSFVDELISENEELRKKLGIPSKRELFNKMLNAAPTNTEVGE